MVEVLKKNILEVADDVVTLSALPPLMAKLAERAHQTGATLGFTSGVIGRGYPQRQSIILFIVDLLEKNAELPAKSHWPNFCGLINTRRAASKV